MPELDLDPALAPTMASDPTRDLHGGASARLAHVYRARGRRLAPRSRRRGRALAAGALAAAATAGAVILGLARTPGVATCTDGPELPAPVWSAPRAAAIEQAVGSAAWAALGPALSRFAGGGIAGHAEACSGPRASRPADLRARQRACLARARAELDGFLDEL